MPRDARKQSETGYMHLIVRGIGKQVLFEERLDYLYYISLLKRYSIETNVKICAFCLMENHVHLLVFDKQNITSLFMKKVGVSYSYYFNKKYERSGHLFQDRYKSEPIESESYLLTVFRYILNNPAKAGICPAAEYKWSSYKSYGYPYSFVHTRIFQKILGTWDEYAAYIAEKNDDLCMEFDDHKYSNNRDDEWAMNIIRRELGITSGTMLQQMDMENRNDALRRLKNTGISLRQIERLTGINRNVIYRVWQGNRGGFSPYYLPVTNTVRFTL